MKTKIIITLMLLIGGVAAYGQQETAPDVNLTVNLPDRDCNPVIGRMFVMPISADWGATWTTDVSGWSAWGGNLGGISGADAKCQNYAVQFGLPGEYEALIAGTPPEGGDRMTKHWEDELRNPVTGALIGGGMTSDGDVLKIKDAFSGICGRANLGGTTLNYDDVVLLPDGTIMIDAEPSTDSPELVHGYLVHTANGNIPGPDMNCDNWSNFAGYAWAAFAVGELTYGQDYSVGAFYCVDDVAQGGNLPGTTCAKTGDHGIFCVGK